MQAAHPFAVALGQVVVDRDHVDAASGQRIQIAGQRRRQRLALAGAHFSDSPRVQCHAADHLNIEVALTQHALARLTDQGERFRQKVIQRPALLLDLLLPFSRLPGEILVGQRRHGGFEFIDAGDDGAHFFQFALVFGADDLLNQIHSVRTCRCVGGLGKTKRIPAHCRNPLGIRLGDFGTPVLKRAAVPKGAPR